ncbi:MAG TPA: hypothetical protein VF057_07245 [Thermoanaerobaculia bacterium]
MKRNVCLTALLCLLAVSATGQDRSTWRTAADVREGATGTIVGTVADVEEARSRVHIQPDDDSYQRLTVVSDSVTTQYFGFGGVINGQPEIFRGSQGLSNIRVGDRIEVRGVGRAGYVLAAEQVRLLGRAVEAGSVGVGSTRPSTSVSTPTNTIPSTRATTTAGHAEGTVRQVNASDGRIVIQTPQRRMITINANRSTPVYYRGEVYRINNLEVGDVIRVEPEPRSAAADEITARSIEVTQSVQESTSDRPADQRLTAVIGRVSRVESSANMIRVDSGREEVRVDLIRATDAAGRRVRAADLRVGDTVDITGSYSGNSDVFLASTIRFSSEPVPPGSEIIVRDDDEEDREIGDFVIVNFSGTITESLQTSPVLVVRDRASGTSMQVLVTDDFVIRNRTGGYAAASTLNVGDSILIKAYRDEGDNLIAQTIRLR